MKFTFKQRQIALAAVAALGATAFGVTPTPVVAAGKTPGKYVSGDFHNHTTCSDGSISMQKLVKKATDKSDGTYGLDWFVQAGHGGTGNRNCTLVEDASLATPAYPVVNSASTGALLGPNTTWQNSNPSITPKGDVSGSGSSRNMWRWQALQEFQYPLLEYLNAYLNRPLFLGTESVVAGHEHTSMSVVTGQMPAAIDGIALPAAPGYTPLGNANALAQWQYCFDRGNSDNSRGANNQWTCEVPGSLNNLDPSWNLGAAKLVPASGAGTGTRGHNKTVEGIKWMAQYHPDASYYVPAHLERAGPFNPDGNNGYNVEHLRNFNNAGPRVAFGFETQPGHGASSERGEYFQNRNNIGGVLVDSVGGTTFGGTGVYGAQIGGVWDALLGEGRNWWFFASSDWHNRGNFSVDDRRSSQDFLPGEYQRNYTMVRNGDDPKLRPQAVVDGLRSGNNWVASGQLIDRLAFVACATGPGYPARPDQSVVGKTFDAATGNTDIDVPNCATMGEKLVVKPGSDIVVAIVVRDPSGSNYAPYTFSNPSLAQIGLSQPLNAPVLDHVDVIQGLVTGFKTPGASDYAGEWPRDWLTKSLAGTASLNDVPAAAKNTSARLLRTFNGQSWQVHAGDAQYKKMVFRIPAVQASQYLRLRGSNLPANVPFETDANGNPLADAYTNTTASTATDRGTLRIPCTTTGTNVPDNGVEFRGTNIDGCPKHLPSYGGVSYSAFDVAAWSDLWFYSNPIYVEVQGAGATRVAGVK